MRGHTVKVQDHSLGGVIHGTVHGLYHTLGHTRAIVPAIGQPHTFLRQQHGTFFAAGADLLAVLEDQINVPVGAFFLQLQRQAAKGGHMAVVTAFMSAARDPGHVIPADRILYRQRIQLRAESDPGQAASGTVMGIEPPALVHHFQPGMSLQKVHQVPAGPGFLQ